MAVKPGITQQLCHKPFPRGREPSFLRVEGGCHRPSAPDSLLTMTQRCYASIAFLIANPPLQIEEEIIWGDHLSFNVYCLSPPVLPTSPFPQAPAADTSLPVPANRRELPWQSLMPSEVPRMWLHFPTPESPPSSDSRMTVVAFPLGVKYIPQRQVKEAGLGSPPGH